MDQLSASFTLLPNLVWSDGTPLTASDSVFAFNLLTDLVLTDLGTSKSGGYQEARTASYLLGDDERGLTAIWTGLPGFLDPTYYTNFYSPKPEHVMGQYTPEELDNTEEIRWAPLGWGPYVIDERVAGESMWQVKA